MDAINLNAPQLFSLKGETALVTGAGSGIGRCIALGFAQCGANVACLDNREDDGLRQTIDLIEQTGQKTIGIQSDVTNKTSMQEAIEKTEQSLGPLSIALNAAGIANANPAEEMEESQYQTLMDINMKGIFLSCQAEANAMLGREKGTIINIASMSGVIVNRGLEQVHYNASKAGVIHMTKSFAMEWVNRGIRVNSISPGYTATSMNTRMEMIHQTKVFESQTPMQRMADVDEMVGPAIFLASNASSYCTGVDLLVDGGFCCW
ncbi:MAG: SDR family oxidoreductase [Ostreibacterium sp.]